MVKVEIGRDIPALVRTITQEKINRYAEASGDYNPLHVDPDYAVGTEFGGTIAHGLLTLAYLCQMMEAWIGEAWCLTGELEVSLLFPVKPGETIASWGQVVDQERQGEEQLITCRIGCKNQRGQDVVSGEAMVRIPVDQFEGDGF